MGVKITSPHDTSAGQAASSTTERRTPPRPSRAQAIPARQGRTKTLVLVGLNGQLVCEVCHLADTLHARMRGVIGWKQLRSGEGVLLRPAFSIHTAFVRFPIDAVFLDKRMTVISIAHELKPWRTASSRHAKSVLELAAGECRRLGIREGDQLGWGLL